MAGGKASSDPDRSERSHVHVIRKATPEDIDWIRKQMIDFTDACTGDVTIIDVNAPEGAAGEGLLVGSGLFVNILGECSLITAGHVVRKAQCYEPAVYHRRSDNLPPGPYWLPGIVLGIPEKEGEKTDDRRGDLGALRVHPSQLQDSVIKPLPIVPYLISGDGTSTNLGRDLLFCHGYLSEKSRPSGLAAGMMLMRGNFLAQEAPCTWKHFDPEVHFAVAFMSNSPPTNPYGLSGSAVWQTNTYGRDLAEWSPEQARVVGVVTVWHPDSKTIVVTRIEVVRRLLEHIIKLIKEHSGT